MTHFFNSFDGYVGILIMILKLNDLETCVDDKILNLTLIGNNEGYFRDSLFRLYDSEYARNRGKTCTRIFIIRHSSHQIRPRISLDDDETCKNFRNDVKNPTISFPPGARKTVPPSSTEKWKQE